MNGERKYLKDRRELRYLSIPPEANIMADGRWEVNFDLRKGASCVIEKDHNKIKKALMDDLLHWIVTSNLFFNYKTKE